MRKYKLQTFASYVERKPHHKRKGVYWWRLVAKNGRIIAIGGEPFTSRYNEEKAGERVLGIHPVEIIYERL